MRLDPRVKERLKQTFVDEMAMNKSVLKIISTYPLSAEEQKQIVAHFPEFQSTVTENVVDPSLLGGFILKQGSKAVDLSLRFVLQTLQKKLV
jgi:F0F1-type ATP synthase delta subunit